MNARTMCRIDSVIFGAITVLHGLRAIKAVPVMIGTFAVPLWESWAAVVLSGFLAYVTWVAK